MTRIPGSRREETKAAPSLARAAGPAGVERPRASRLFLALRISWSRSLTARPSSRETRPERRERVGEQAHELGASDSDELTGRAGRVGQRPERVEDRADAELAADGSELPHRRMERRGEEEDQAGLVQDPSRTLRVEIDGHA